MIKRCSGLFLATYLCAPVWAVYAPVPEEELGKALTWRLEASAFHDSNIFGAPSDEISSMVYRLAPSVTFNSSVTDQTFVSLGYQLTYDYIEERPLHQALTSQLMTGRVAHAFSERTTIDINETFTIAKNPESLLAGVPLNTDQSLKNNQLDLTFNGGLGEKLGFTFKARSTILDFDLATLAVQLNRDELLAGFSGDYKISEASKLVAEYRHLDVSYDQGGALKDKRSDFWLVGMDFAPSKKTSVTVRAGLEHRKRATGSSEDAPSAEVTARFAYTEKSFISAGYILALEESSNVDLYTDSQVNRFFVNVQHALSGQSTASLFYNVEPTTLNGRVGISPDRTETTQRFGAAFVYSPRHNWTLVGTVDVDATNSEDPFRDLKRNRYGLDVRYAF